MVWTPTTESGANVCFGSHNNPLPDYACLHFHKLVATSILCAYTRLSVHVHGTLSISPFISGFAGSIGDFPLAVPEKFHCSTQDLLTLTQISGVSVTDLKCVCVHLCESTQIHHSATCKTSVLLDV